MRALKYDPEKDVTLVSKANRLLTAGRLTERNSYWMYTNMCFRLLLKVYDYRFVSLRQPISPITCNVMANGLRKVFHNPNSTSNS